MNGRDMKIIDSTTSYADAQTKIESIPTFVEESDKDRQKLYSRVWENDEELPEAVKAEVKWMGKSCVRVKLKKKSFSWYELVTVDVVDIDIGESGDENVSEDVPEHVSEDDIVRHGKKRKRKVKAENGGEEVRFKNEDVEMA